MYRTVSVNGQQVALNQKLHEQFPQFSRQIFNSAAESFAQGIHIQHI
jgi:hypothetical protein